MQYNNVSSISSNSNLCMENKLMNYEFIRKEERILNYG